MRSAAVALALLLAGVAGAADDRRMSRLSGGGPRADDCLATLDVVGVEAAPRARTVVCTDGDTRCDRDGLVNGRCELWLRACLDARDDGCETRPVVAATVANPAGDRDLTMLARTLERVALPSTDANACGALTTLTVPLGTRRNGSARKGRKVVALDAAASDGREDRDAVTFLCKPPPRVRRRDAITFDGLRTHVFEKSCAFSGCHGTTNPQAGLVLVGDDAYQQLVGRPASTSSAKFAGKKLVVPGAPETSFLMDKIEGKLGPGEGAAMPYLRPALRPEQVEAIRKWILAGAPRERAVPGGLGEADRQPRIPTPAAPAGGYQAHMTPFMLGDLPETEGCQVVQLDNADPFFVQQWELLMHEGSHHFILRAHRCPDPDGDGVTECDDPGFLARYPTGFAPCEQFGYDWAFVVGSQTSHFLVDYQTATTGVAFQLHRHQPLLLNSHYTNPYADTMAEVWVNATPVDAALVRHPAKILFEDLASAFIKVSPGTANDDAHHLACAFADDIFCTLGGEDPPAAEHFALLGLTSHMHKRSRKFVTDLHAGDGPRVERPDDMTDADDGAKHLYVSTDWHDPVNLNSWPPTVVTKGDQLTYRCFHDNGVTTPVRLGCEEEPGVPPGRSIFEQVAAGKDAYAGASKWCRTDADCAGFGTGRCVPANLVFGDLADDDMCILPGLYSPCSGDAASCLE
jgi:hypothetical protein